MSGSLLRIFRSDSDSYLSRQNLCVANFQNISWLPGLSKQSMSVTTASFKSTLSDKQTLAESINPFIDPSDRSIVLRFTIGDTWNWVKVEFIPIEPKSVVSHCSIAYWIKLQFERFWREASSHRRTYFILAFTTVAQLSPHPRSTFWQMAITINCLELEFMSW